MLSDRMFIHTKIFDKLWEAIGCNDDDLAELQKTICKNPKKYPVIKGTGGIRKIRIPLDGSGKSSGARVLYIDFEKRSVVGLLYTYSKGVKIIINNNERKILKDMVNQLNEIWEK